MKTLRALLFFVITIATLAGCKKKADLLVITPPAHTPKYFPLTPGSYWIYRRAWKDTTGADLANNPIEFDSCYVEKDTIIDFVKYAKFYSVNAYGSAQVLYLKDSFGYIISNWNYVFLTDIRSPQILPPFFQGYSDSDTMYKVTTQIYADLAPISTPAGFFMTRDISSTFNFAPWRQSSFEGRTYHTYYADSVGLVLQQSIGYADGPPYYSEHRLVRYHVQ